jgi:hypothetical protein
MNDHAGDVRVDDDKATNMIRVKVRDLINAGWERGAGGAWYLKTRDDPQTHLHLGGRGDGDRVTVAFVSIKFQDRYHAHYYNGGNSMDRGSIEDLPVDVQTLFRIGLNRIGMS